MQRLIRNLIAKAPRFFAVLLPLLAYLLVIILKKSGYIQDELTGIIIITISMFFLYFGVSTPWVGTKQWRYSKKLYQKLSSIENNHSAQAFLTAAMFSMPAMLFFNFNLFLKLVLFTLTLIIFTVYWFIPFAILFTQKNNKAKV